MTGAQEPDQDPINRWLATHHANVQESLTRFLDLDTGLREATLHGEHTDLKGDLSSRLDIEAGLQAVLPAPLTPEAPLTATQTGTKQTDVVAALKALDPAVRMTLRRAPVIRAVILSYFLVRALDIAEQVLTRRSLGRGKRGLPRRSDLAGTLDLVLNSHIALSFDLDCDLARDLDLDRTRVFDKFRDLVHGCDLDLTRVDRVTRAVIRGYARDIAQSVAVEAGRALGIQQVDGLAAALLDGALDDFTDADLTHADLTEVDLTGVCWSMSGTKWPEGTDVDALRARSRQVAPDTDIYVVTRDGGKKARHHVPV